MDKRTCKVALLCSSALLMVLDACSATRVYSPVDTPGYQTGSVIPLAKVLKKAKSTLILVFVHGVGDHCRGYALGAKRNPIADAAAWLNPRAMKVLHLTPIPNTWEDHEITARELHVGEPGRDNKDNLILLREREYSWKEPGMKSRRKVRAFEITWSPMTRWIKNSLLGYDATKVALLPWIRGSNGVTTCNGDPKDQIGQQIPHDPWFSPPNRVAVNAILKWTVLDRDLADAVIYAGTYGIAMQRGMAVALCRIAGRTENYGKPCVWPTKNGAMRPGPFIFVTHSLGSRLLYDTIYNLMNSGRVQSRSPGIVPLSYPKAWAKEAVVDAQKMVLRTAGFYMMANQLAMLGLARIPISAPINEPQPFLSESKEGLQNLNARQTFFAKTDSLVGILRARKMLLGGHENKHGLNIVSFNDTDDLLTWHIPAWYATTGEGAMSDGVHIADVFVKNAPRFLDLAEWPPTAHSGYLENKAVWQVIYCGATNGHVNACSD